MLLVDPRMDALTPRHQFLGPSRTGLATSTSRLRAGIDDIDCATRGTAQPFIWRSYGRAPQWRCGRLGPLNKTSLNVATRPTRTVAF